MGSEEEDYERRPFKVLLDVGLRRTTTGARVFGVMKGAIDGGLLIPHSTSRIAGSSDAKHDKHHKDVDRNAKRLDAKKEKEPKEEKKEKKGKGKDMKYYIYSQHVADYMRKLKAENEDAYKRQFSRYIKEGITADNLESIYKKAHEAIRKDPSAAAKAKDHYKLKVPQTKALSHEEKVANLNKKLEAAGIPIRKANLAARLNKKLEAAGIPTMPKAK